MKRYSVIATICIVAVFSCSFMGCNQQKEGNSVNAQDGNIPVVNVAGIPLLDDFYYTDPVVTENGDLLVLGNASHTVKQFNNELYFNFDNDIVEFVSSENYLVSPRSELVTTPAWFTNNSFLTIDSITFNPATFNIYILGSKTIHSRVHYDDSFLNDPEDWYKKTQEIGVITNSSITQRFPIDSDIRFSKIRFFQESETSPIILLLSSTDGVLYYTSPSSELISFDTILPPNNTFVTWDVAGNTLVALDHANQLHMFTLSTTENRLQADEINPPIPYPLSEEMTDPHLLYNPVNNCIVLWDAVSEGKCLYALKDNVNWKWKQIAVSPTALFPYNLESFSTNSMSDKLPTPSLYEPSLLFSFIGSDSSRVGNYYYPVYTNPYEEGDLEGIYDKP